MTFNFFGKTDTKAKSTSLFSKLSKTLDLLVTQDNEIFDRWIGEVIANFNSVIEEFKQLDEAK